MDERLKALRKELGLNQQQFADRLKIKRGTIANYEIGRNTPIDGVISLICMEFNVNEEWLRCGKGEMFNELDREEELMKWAGKVLGGQDTFQKKFVRMLMSLSENEWEFIESKAKELVGYEGDTNKKD